MTFFDTRWIGFWVAWPSYNGDDGHSFLKRANSIIMHFCYSRGVRKLALSIVYLSLVCEVFSNLDIKMTTCNSQCVIIALWFLTMVYWGTAKYFNTLWFHFEDLWKIIFKLIATWKQWIDKSPQIKYSFVNKFLSFSLQLLWFWREEACWIWRGMDKFPSLNKEVTIILHGCWQLI